MCTVTINTTYLLTPWSRVLLEKLTGSATSQEIPRVFGTRKFITVLTSARHLSLSWANSIQSPQPPPTSWRFILILSSHLHLGLPIGLNFFMNLILMCQAYKMDAVHETSSFKSSGTRRYVEW